MNSRRLGLLSVACSAASVFVLLDLPRVMPGVKFPVLVTIDVAAVVLCILAALGGSKLWLLASVWPMLFAGVLVLSMFADFHP